MDTIAPAMPVLPTELRHRRVRLDLGPAAAAHACGHVRSAIVAWSVPVNPAVAILLTSDLVINAVTNGASETITLGIRWSSGQFRVEVHDASVTGDSWETADADADAERGLQLAAVMAAECGHYRTPAGRAVYYVLALDPQAVVPSQPSNDPSAVPGGPDKGSREDSFRVGYPELAPRGAASGGGEP
ncbi:MAG TPA: ATP-binding protein [Trebonia sp.]